MSNWKLFSGSDSDRIKTCDRVACTVGQDSLRNVVNVSDFGMYYGENFFMLLFSRMLLFETAWWYPPWSFTHTITYWFRHTWGHFQGHGTVGRLINDSYIFSFECELTEHSLFFLMEIIPSLSHDVLACHDDRESGRDSNLLQKCYIFFCSADAVFLNCYDRFHARGVQVYSAGYQYWVHLLQWFNDGEKLYHWVEKQPTLDVHVACSQLSFAVSDGLCAFCVTWRSGGVKMFTCLSVGISGFALAV